jgi:large subunit ribosomal protein L21
MFAVIKTENHQYRVREGDVIAVNRLEADVGARLDLPEVLFIQDGDGVRIGTPVLPGVKVTAEVVGHTRALKVYAFKFARRKGFKRLRGHRQDRTLLRIVGITAS